MQAPTLPPGVTTNASYHFIISQPGSYYLSANLGVTKTHGIQINTEGVTLDLNGFEISRASGSLGGNGIEIPATSHRAAVRNGSLKGFQYGIRTLTSGGFARGCAFRDLAVSGCTLYGILAGEGAVLEACRAHNNSGTSGIHAENGSTLSYCSATGNTTTNGISTGFGSTLSHCTASGNTGTNGISAGFGSTLSHCTASGNTGTNGILGANGSTLSHCAARANTVDYGIVGSEGSTLSHCVAYNNQSSAPTSAGIGTGNASVIRHCTAAFTVSTAASTPTTGMGFSVGSSSTIEGCTAYASEGNGIRLLTDTLARANTSIINGNGGDGAGIHATGSDNRLEANNVSGNDRGIDVDAAGNCIIKNSASGNPTNYDLAANNVFGAIVDRAAPASAAVSGNSAASSAGTTDPWANISY